MSSAATGSGAYQRGGFDGIAYVFSADDPFTGVDIDDCRDPETGEISAAARTIIATLDTYCEVSPSSSGVKLVLVGSKPGKRCVFSDIAGLSRVEIYSERRYWCMTGHHVPGSPREPRQRQVALTALFNRGIDRDSDFDPTTPVNAETEVNTGDREPPLAGDLQRLCVNRMGNGVSVLTEEWLERVEKAIRLS